MENNEFKMYFVTEPKTYRTVGIITFYKEKLYNIIINEKVIYQDNDLKFT